MTSITKITKPLFWIWLIVPLIFTLAGNVSAQGTCVPLPAGMVSWWPGEGNAIDIAGYNDGTLENGMKFAAGMVGQAFSFDGVNDKIAIANESAFDFTTQVSVDAWVFSTGAEGNYQGVVNKGYSSGGPFELRMTRQGDEEAPRYLGCTYAHAMVFGVTTEIGHQNALVCLTKDVWHHVVGTYDGTAIRLYLDGDLVTSPSGIVSEIAHSGTLIQNNLPVSIGWNGDFGEYWSGLIDEVGIYNRALEASEIKAIYDAGSAGKCKVTTVDIDIRPWSKRNPINYRGHGILPIAILSTEDFDALSQVDQESLTFGATGNEKSLAFCNHRPKDFNRDGVKNDLVCQFYIEVAGFRCGDTKGILKGNTLNGIAFEGEDLVRIIHCK